ncbi:hypothetical protein PGT21_001462 [Puccinia graminis f. sp. tritici]|uniref:Uncharacterized protein n=1 Tax=Puccinia graminis f. sp. tritici TaxID=56615 RepID=A0A5B0MKM9_PUCGR|nr:hypothetical protein PGT21_001462 [Puccinia graminis f. sp. tritici]
MLDDHEQRVGRRSLSAASGCPDYLTETLPSEFCEIFNPSVPSGSACPPDMIVGRSQYGFRLSWRPMIAGFGIVTRFAAQIISLSRGSRPHPS